MTTMCIRLASLKVRGRQVAGAALAVAMLVAPMAAQAQAPDRMVETLPRLVENTLGMRLVLLAVGQVPAPGELKGGGRTVGIDRPIYMGVTEVTHGELQAFLADRGAVGSLGGDPDAAPLGDPEEPLLGAPGLSPSTPRHPAQFMSLGQARAFAEWLSATEGRRYRLPTEEEWEYACRAGTTRPPTDPAGINEIANIADRAFQQSYPVRVRVAPIDDGHAFAAPVGSYRANGLGLHDMIGNVWEWVADGPYTRARPDATPGTATSKRGTWTARGGGFASGPQRAHCGARLEALPHYRDATTGFRLVLEISP